MNLESAYEKSKAEYLKLGYDENSWQWKDEGIVYCIMDYLSSFELTDADRSFAKKACIEEELAFAESTLHENS